MAELTNRAERDTPAAIMPEGWDVLALHLGLVVCAAAAVQVSGWQALEVSLPLVALVAALFGLLLARSAIVDALAHLVALVAGIIFASLIVAVPHPELGARLPSRVKSLIQLEWHWYLGHPILETNQRLLMSVLMAAMVWLVTYLAAWTLFRRGWVFASLLIPGFLLLINLGYAPRAHTWPLIAYLILGGTLAARFHLVARQRDWSRLRIPSPDSFASRFFTIGIVVAILATSIGWAAPSPTVQRVLEPLLSRVQQPIDAIQQKSDDLWSNATGTNGTGTVEAGSYSSFANAFSIGGPLKLSDQPALLLKAPAAEYLAAQHYDVYSGHGWSTDVESTFNPDGPDGRTYSPEMTFAPGQRVLLSSEVNQQRAEIDGTIVVLTPTGKIMLSPELYRSSSQPASVRMSWRQLKDERFSLADDELGQLPPDLQRIARLVRHADFGSDVVNGLPQALDVSDQDEINAELAQLRQRFLDVRYDIDANGMATDLVVSGQLPVYDDVEIVFSRQPLGVGSTYEYTALASTASPDQLRNAGTDYPGYVERRYLQLPTTITPRTTQLAHSLTASTDTPFDAAMAIQDYLRSHITYNENVPVPPKDQDVVDYVLFDNPQGYCEYYATSMVVMLRALGIPARLVAGYYPGTLDPQQGGYLYRQKNAHAWVEVFFPGYGWIPFEPTASRPDLAYGDQPGQSAEQAATPPVKLTPPTGQQATPPGNLAIAGTPPASLPGVVTTPDEGGGSGGNLLLAGLIVAVALLAGGIATAFWFLPLRDLSPIDAVFARLLRFGRFAGVPASGATTPHEFAESLGDRIPSTRAPAMKIVDVYEVNRYGDQRADGRLVALAAQEWHRLRGQALKVIFRRRRRRAKGK